MVDEIRVKKDDLTGFCVAVLEKLGVPRRDAEIVTEVLVVADLRNKGSHGVTGFVAVRNSNHYGIAGYFALMAVKEGCIGMSVTNTAPLVVPTFGQDAILGTNPIAVAMPADGEPFVFDAATSVVPRGKLEVYDRQNKTMPLGWAVD